MSVQRINDDDEQFMGCWQDMCSHLFFLDCDAYERLSETDQRDFLDRRKAVTEKMDNSVDVQYYELETTAYALKMGWTDVAAHLLSKTFCDPDPDPEPEPTQILGNCTNCTDYTDIERPFMYLVWTRIAFLYLQDNDLTSLRKLIKGGILTREMIIDMLYYASIEEANIRVTKATVVVVIAAAATAAGIEEPPFSVSVSDIDQAREVLRTTTVEDSDQRLFCHAEQRELLYELMKELGGVSLDPESKIFKVIVSNILRHHNVSLFKFLIPMMESLDQWRSHRTFKIKPEESAFELVVGVLGVWMSCFSPSEILGPSGLLTTFVKELRLAEFISLWYNDLGLGRNANRKKKREREQDSDFALFAKLLIDFVHGRPAFISRNRSDLIDDLARQCECTDFFGPLYKAPVPVSLIDEWARTWGVTVRTMKRKKEQKLSKNEFVL